MSFEFATATRIIFGRGSLATVGSLASALGRRAFVATWASSSRAAPLLGLLEGAGVAYRVEACSGEPSFESARKAIAAAQDFGADLVIGFGGGSAIDTAKVVGALLANGGDPLDYAEVIGAGKPLTRDSLPVIAIPTTSGTGSEVTRNAVLTASEGVKVSLRAATLLPALALVDPELCLSLPARVTADSGLDALTQLLEPFVSARRNPLVDALCREGMARGLRSLPKAFAAGRRAEGEDPPEEGDIEAREDMALASLFGGLALANAGLGAVHGLAGPIGGLVGSPHGALCAALLPVTVGVNVRALAARATGDEALSRYAEIASLVLGRPARAEELGPALARFGESLETRRLGELGVGRADFPAIVRGARAASSMKANPIALEEWELLAILEAAL